MSIATLLRSLVLVSIVSGLSACSSFAPRDPLNIDLVGLEPLPGEGLEVRFAVKLRVQNPNETALDFNGVALQLDINDQPLARGVSDQSGQVARFGETLISVPMTISAYSALRQAWGASTYQPGQSLPYQLRGKLAGGVFGTRRFSDSGQLTWPQPIP
ncbi:LEA/WHy family protein [Phytopseudomonas dryadis]|uniref:Water stress/hypersensitive response domain-containing protein n=1 Tax=Phytopseudomonas dryadis TaxID=2487520 RepID=A0A4Q9QSV5_9GAMM|nr:MULTISPECIES: LEA type 2 family protein [Pseudomonas]TBU84826.1 water stress/hypersensitive response domain-containing protein [Pseudomonas dryadis]TBV01248.1 water stress/hypersensitive response domain-containing protein [Pseudomonas dryadis]TBV14714.1 water stress/hypersensitive response domain-containing protein [Pseudomonas sp. FRB 230]